MTPETVHSSEQLNHRANVELPRRRGPKGTHENRTPASPVNGNGFHSSLTKVFRQEVLGQTPSLGGMVNALAIAASHDVIVLLNGETGTGKTHLAQLIHEHSSRKHHPLLVVPCGALSAGLVASELFGHAKGAFSGADRDKVGKFEAAGQGTLLLDEIDTLGLEQQAGLLRVIETGAYEPVGSNITRTCQARIIVASNWDLEAAMLAGRFREDLYYRLNVFSFHLPPLRERVQDIPTLAQVLATRFAAKLGKPFEAICPKALEALVAFPWPGNIRQLENVVQQTVLFGTGPKLLREHLPPLVRDFSPPKGTNDNPAGEDTASPCQPDFTVPASTANGSSLKETRAAQERAFIESVLQESNNCRSRAAEVLGISRATLYNKMKKYGITRAG